MVTKNGTPGNDTLLGTAQNDILRGLGGNDLLRGKGGNDLLIGGFGADRIQGGGGNDTIRGSGGNDTLSGGSGDDTIEGGNGRDTIRGGGGDDTISGGAGDDTITAGLGNDRIIWNEGNGSDTINGGEGTDTMEINYSDAVALSQNNGVAIFNRVGLNPFSLSIDNTERFEVNGSIRDDSLDINDLAGTEITNVTFSSGGGNDILDGTETAVQILANGGAGDDQLTAGAGNDTVNGDAGNDTLRGGNGVDVLQGGDGNDTVVGDRGGDTMSGGAGDDLLIWNNGDGSDTINGDAGTDRVQVNGSVTDGDAFILNQNAGQAIFDRTNLVPFKLTVDDAEQFEVNGGGGDDTFEVNNLSNTDVALVTFTGGAGNDTLDGTDTTTQLVGLGGDGNDTLAGGSAADQLTGGAGNDTLTGNAGSDVFGFSSDVAFSSAALGIDTITDFVAGTDKILLDQTTFGTITLADIAIVATDALAATATQLITYSTGTGNLFFNQNRADAGLGSGGQFAALTGAPTLTTADFTIVA